ncbi:hypothetical protein R1sor_023939 [Riccia sorocarpa]|uniref:Uncharacterized protein n=1 Tax=Riccia sorocarpa TaxID=122646 RepID=A0ABD3GP84_9MARC
MGWGGIHELKEISIQANLKDARTFIKETGKRPQPRALDRQDMARQPTRGQTRNHRWDKEQTDGRKDGESRTRRPARRRQCSRGTDGRQGWKKVELDQEAGSAFILASKLYS